MINYFEEKQHQVIPDKLNAFGIEIYSRYGKADEICEMLNFVSLATNKNVSKFIKKVFYDTKSNFCEIETDESLIEGGKDDLLLLEIAEKTIGQFEWHGVVKHGAPLKEKFEV